MERVLLVEDDYLVNMALRDHLHDARFAVEVAYSGMAALAAIQRCPPRCLVTDLDLGPGPDGFEVARYARSARPDMRVVFISSDHTRGRVAGSAFIAKPLRGEEIVEALLGTSCLAAA